MSEEANVPPHDAELEKRVLSLMFSAPEQTLDACLRAGLRSAWFYVPAYRHLWEVLRGCEAEGVPPGDVAGVAHRLKEQGALEALGGLPGLMDVLSAAGGGMAFLPHHLQVLAELAERRRTMQELRAALQAVEMGEKPALVWQRVECAAEAQNGQEGAKESYGDLLRAVIDSIEEQANRKGLLGVSSGFRLLDMALDGLVAGRYYVLGARSGMGKTAMALNVALAVAKCQEERFPGKVLFLSGEMPPRELVQRMLGIEGGVCSRVQGELTREQRMYLSKAYHRIVRLPFDFLDVSGWTVERVIHEVRRRARREPLRLVVLDYLQLLRSEAVRDSSDRVGQVAAVSNALRDFAHASNFPLLVLAQINRESAKASKKDAVVLPTVEDLKGSGDIEQDADAVMLLHRPEKALNKPEEKKKYQGKAFLNVDKNRYGETGVVELVWEGFCQRFREAVRITMDRE